ncbi:MAG: hypothetical protein WA652_18150, partial [Xanthobacteraceae bacterium]
GAALAIVLLVADPVVTRLLSSWSRFRSESELALLAVIGGVVYGGIVLVLFGRRWLLLMRRTAQSAESAPIEAVASADETPDGD